MDRATVYTQEQGRSVDFLFAQRAAMIGLAKLSQAALGSNTVVRGLAVTPNSPAALNVLVGTGEIYSMADVDATAWGSLPADTSDVIFKQGLNMTAQTLSTPAPSTAGYSINYLVEAQYEDQDTNPVVLPFYNSANPSQPLNGQGNGGATLPTQRQGICAIQVKAGVAAATGTQVTPSVDSGWTALAVVTVANGQTQVLSGNISVPAGVPQITSLLQMMQTDELNYAVAGGTSDALTATLPAGVSALTDGFPVTIKLASANTTTTPSLNLTLGTTAAGAMTIVKGANAPLVPGDLAGLGAEARLVYNETNANWVLLNPATGVVALQAGITGSIKNLKSTAPGLNSYTTVLTADEAILKNGSEVPITVYSVNLTLNANGTVGAPLSVMSARAASTWYYIWLWYNATNGLTATFDTSATAPTAPTGYVSTDYKCRTRATKRTDSSANTYLLQIETDGKVSQYVPTPGSNTLNTPAFAGGVNGTFDVISPTWLAVTTANVVPTGANAKINLIALPTSSTNNAMIVAPNGNYGGPQTTNPPPVSTVNYGNTISKVVQGTFLLESANVYVAMEANNNLQCLGWEEV